VGDIFVDCEWTSDNKTRVIGAYSPGQGRFQLYGKNLIRKCAHYEFSRFLNHCSKRCSSRDILLFSHHGVDISRIEKVCGLKLRTYYYCINTVTAFKKLARFRTARLEHLEKHFRLPRIRDKMNSFDVDSYWFTDPQKVLDYNWEDCLKLWQLVNILKTEYQITRSDFRSICMPP
jgi:hypothetical protein